MDYAAKLHLVSACALLWMGATDLAAQEPESSTTNLVVGLLLPPEEPAAADIREAVLLAIETVNRESGQKVEAVIRGRTGQWGADAMEAGRMVLDDRASLLIAPPDGSATHLVLQVAGRTATPVVSLCPDSSVTRAGVPWMVRAVPRTAEEAGCILRTLAARKLKAECWSCFAPGGRAGREIVKDLRQAATDANGKLQMLLEAEPEGHFEGQVQQVLAAAPDGIFVWLDPLPAAALVKTLRKAKYNGLLAGPARLNCPAFLESSGVSAKGFLLPAILSDTESRRRYDEFEKAYQKRWGKIPGWTAAMAYDAALLSSSVLRHVPGDALARAFSPEFSLPGVSGLLTFDPEGNRNVKLELLRAAQGRFVPASTSTDYE